MDTEKEKLINNGFELARGNTRHILRVASATAEPVT